MEVAARNGTFQIDEADLGSIAGLRLSIHRARNTSYVRDSRGVYLHRLLLGLDKGDPRQADHLNRDGLDNRRANLRIVTAAEQRQNQGVRRDKRTGSHRGVFLNRRTGRWYGQVQKGGRKFNTPHRGTEAEVVEEVRELRSRLFPFSTD